MYSVVACMGCVHQMAAHGFWGVGRRAWQQMRSEGERRSASDSTPPCVALCTFAPNPNTKHKRMREPTQQRGQPSQPLGREPQTLPAARPI